jgi:poly-beta-hydroxybutyrate-responsive repressor
MHICEPRQFLRPCLLLLLKERPGHGYEMADRLKPFGVGDGDSGRIYRTLRALERSGLARSVWRPSVAGPARRTYHLTAEGCQALDSMVRDLRDTRCVLDHYLDRYQRPGPDPTLPTGLSICDSQSSAVDQSIVDSTAG